jgi:hypothetical protein
MPFMADARTSRKRGRHVLPAGPTVQEIDEAVPCLRHCHNAPSFEEVESGTTDVMSKDGFGLSGLLGATVLLAAGSGAWAQGAVSQSAPAMARVVLAPHRAV